MTKNMKAYACKQVMEASEQHASEKKLETAEWKSAVSFKEKIGSRVKKTKDSAHDDNTDVLAASSSAASVIIDFDCYLDMLKTRLEDVYGIPLRTPKDFLECSEAIMAKTHKSVSHSTLKRIYGYLPTDESYMPSSYSLNTLSEFIGYQNFRDFCKHCRLMKQTRGEVSVEELVRSTVEHLDCAAKGLRQLCNLLGVYINGGGNCKVPHSDVPCRMPYLWHSILAPLSVHLMNRDSRRLYAWG